MRARLLLLVLLVVVPLQGLAAATRALCAPHAAPTAPAVAHADRSHDSQWHDHHASADHAHSGAFAAGVGDKSVGDAPAAGCAHCAACVVGNALVDAARQLTLVDSALAPPAHRPAAAMQRPFDGPERPPRTI